MKMAKASEADLEAAIKIASALEAIDRGLMPEGFDADDGEREDFDIDSGRDCRNVIRHILDLMDNGSIGRVVWGMAVILDPANEAIDPDASAIEHHPKRLEADKVRQQRDELLALLKSIDDSAKSSQSIIGFAGKLMGTLKKVRAAIANVEKQS
jgi:hypothetical protein